MKLFRSPFVQLLSGLTIGVVSGGYALCLLPLFASLIVVAKLRAYPLIFGVGLIVGVVHGGHLRTELIQVESPVMTYTAWAVEDGKHTAFGQQVKVAIDGRTYLSLAELPAYPLIFQGEVLELQGELNLPVNTGEFDYLGYLRSSKVDSVIRPHSVTVTGAKVATEYVIGSLRRLIVNRAKFYLREPERSLFTGFVLGETTGFGEKDAEAFRRTGTSHLVAVSGYNVGLVTLATLSFSGYVSRRKLLRLGVIAVIAYLMLVSVSNLPAMRASIVALYLLGGQIFGHRASSLVAILLAITVSLLDNPFVIQNVSFQLSFAATAGILLLYPIFKQWLWRLPKAASSIISVTGAAAISTLPISIFNFGGVSGVGLVINMIALPLASVLSLLSYVTLALIPLEGGLINFWMSILGQNLRFFIQMLHAVSGLPGIYITDSFVLLISMIGAGLIVYKAIDAKRNSEF